MLMAAGGMLLARAPEVVEPSDARGLRVVLAGLLGISLAVSGANVLNMWWERDSDARMHRTARRPLPSGRLHPNTALGLAAALVVLSVTILAIETNLLTAALAAFAVGSYAFIYTPLKAITPTALLVGAVPGAMPPLLGWTAVTNRIEPAALVLFAIVLVWQLPHFIAIALFRKDEYRRAGIRVVPIVRGDAVAKIEAVAWVTLLVPVSLMLAPLGVASFRYTMAAAILGAAFLGWSFTGLDPKAGPTWARNYFFASLVYLPALTAALVLDVVI